VQKVVRVLVKNGVLAQDKYQRLVFHHLLKKVSTKKWSIKMYENRILNNTLESIIVSEDIFVSNWDKYTTLLILKLIIDKFELDRFLSEYDFSKQEYESYFQDYVKSQSKNTDKRIRQEFKTIGD
jgi:hypothetical protein